MPHACSILIASGSRPGAREPGGDVASHAATSTKLSQHGEVSFRFGSHNGLSVAQSRIWFPGGLQSIYSPTKLPEPGGCHHRPVLRCPGPISRLPAGTRNSRTQTLLRKLKNSVGRAPTRNPNHQPGATESQSHRPTHRRSHRNTSHREGRPTRPSQPADPHLVARQPSTAKLHRMKRPQRRADSLCVFAPLRFWPHGLVPPNNMAWAHSTFPSSLHGCRIKWAGL